MPLQYRLSFLPGRAPLGFLFQAGCHECPVCAVANRIQRIFAKNRDNAGPIFPGTLGHQLIDPCPERCQPLGKMQRELVSTRDGGMPEGQAEPHGSLRAGPGPQHAFRPPEQCGQIYSQQGRGHEAEQTESRESTPNVGGVDEDLPVSPVPSDAMQRRRTVGYRNEMVSGVLTVLCDRPLPEVIA